jgi:hypothetical protein
VSDGSLTQKGACLLFGEARGVQSFVIVVVQDFQSATEVGDDVDKGFCLIQLLGLIRDAALQELNARLQGPQLSFTLNQAFSLRA